MGERTVSFVFLGQPLPRYAISSLQLAVRYSGVSVRLIASGKLQGRISRVVDDFVALEDFYDPVEFREAAKRVSFPSAFRNGFWLKTLERLFVLEQFMGAKSLRAIFHAELDQLLFKANILLQSLEMQSERGLFVPFHNPNSAIASVFYSNSQAAIRSLLDSIHDGPSFPNEMTVIARWAAENPTLMYALPTIATIANKSTEPTPHGVGQVSINDIHGVVDAAQLGQWVAGDDPRNISIREVPRTKFVSHYIKGPLTRDQLSQMRFSWVRQDRSLRVRLGDSDETQVFNLHIHSKIHKWLNASDDHLDKMIELSNEKEVVALPGTRKTQILYRNANFVREVLRSPGKAIGKVISIRDPRRSRRRL